MQSQKQQKISIHFQGKPFNIMVIQVYAQTSNAGEAEVERFYEDLQDFLEQTPKKRYHFHYRGLECKSRNSRATWSNRQIWLWSTKWSRAKANKVLPREHIGHSKHPLPTTQEKTLHMDIARWSTPKSDWILSGQRWKAKTRPGTDCGSDHELLITKFRLKLKKGGKTTRSLRYDLNQIPYCQEPPWEIPPMAKVMRKRPDGQRWDQASRGPPSWASTPKLSVFSWLSPTPLTLTGAILDHLSLKKINLGL